MNLSRKDFLLRSTAVVLPFSLTASVRGAEENRDRPSAPGRSQFTVRRCFMQGLRAQPSTRTFCQLTGAQTARILATGSDLTDAANPFQLAPEVDKAALSQQANFPSTK